MITKAIFVALLMISSLAIHAESLSADTTSGVSFSYEDLERFEKMLSEFRQSKNLKLIEDYLNSASPGFKGWMNRRTVTTERLNKVIQTYPEVMAGLPSLEKPLRSLEGDIRGSIHELYKLSGSSVEIPVYYFISSQHQFGGTPVRPVFNNNSLATAAVGIAVGIDFMPRDKPLGDVELAELLAQVVVHEAVHILQVNHQGLENYRSIYDKEKGSMLAIAVREGCAEYLTFLASGRRFEFRYEYALQHEKSLWEEFKTIHNSPPFSVPGWFSGVSENHPDWPFQIGYSLGYRMCEVYHASLPENTSVSELFKIYSATDIEQVYEVFDEKLKH